MLYQAISRINHNGTIYEPGENFDAHPSEMKQALEVGAVAPGHEPYGVSNNEGGQHD
jgi:hypothetical protein